MRGGVGTFVQKVLKLMIGASHLNKQQSQPSDIRICPNSFPDPYELLGFFLPLVSSFTHPSGRALWEVSAGIPRREQALFYEL
jgi:hypothetical protein